MDTNTALFIDNHSESEELLDCTNTGSFLGTESAVDIDDYDTLWQEFCNPVDAWARHALAANGFGGI